MKYLIMIWHNPKSREIWESFSDAERAEGWRAYAALDESLIASGEMVISEALADPSQGRRLPATEGQSLATDGPFPEAKEQLAGFYLVDCESFERALEIAAQVPEASLGLVEVRPVLAMNGPDM
ncbi:YciI family protein [Phytohabitans sp. LJ34]|uniref:YciI family protein n=1 Tax=Phytohabitans sp. LJ34 TaxID=3452217 RepID=UPI003F8A1E77